MSDFSFQESAIQRVLAVIRERPLLVSPTGSGKTKMASEIVKRMNVKTLWIAHRQELLAQASERLPAATIIESVQTMCRRPATGAQLVVVDECQMTAAASYRTILANHPDAMVLGLSAFPHRLDGSPLDMFGRLVIGARYPDLIKAGVLVMPRVYCGLAPDLSGVRRRFGEFSMKPTANAIDKPELTGDIISEWRKHAGGLPTVCYAINIEHSRHIIAEFNAAGIAAEHIDGQSTGARMGAMERLRTGMTQVVSNVDLWTQGTDMPWLKCLIIARPTASLSLHYQIVGRVMRAFDGKTDAIILDHAGNHIRHGLVTNDFQFSLAGPPKRATEPLGMRRCPQCGRYYEEVKCPECGYWPIPKPRPLPPKREGALAEFTPGCERMYYEELKRTQSVFRVVAMFRFRFGYEPVIIGGQFMDRHDRTPANMEKVFRHFYSLAKQRGYQDGWASHRYRSFFGTWPKGFVTRVRLREAMA